MNAESVKLRCLILGCSRIKTESSESIPAIERYDGPPYKVLRRYLRQNSDVADRLDIFILSAEYGLINGNTPILHYERRMTRKRALGFREPVREKLQRHLAFRKYDEIFLSMGQTYLKAMDGIEGLFDEDTKIIISAATSGKKLTELKSWLWDEPLTAASRTAETMVVTPKMEPQTVTLRGKTITLTTNEAVAWLRAHITRQPTAARQVRSWYIVLDDEQISPKWAAQQLFALPVSQFSADEGRRALRQLGLNCYQQ
jgi:hypothetical protein